MSLKSFERESGDHRGVAIIRAVEECDREGRLLDFDRRRSATREAGGSADGEGEAQVQGERRPAGRGWKRAFLARRAQVLAGRVAELLPGVEEWGRSRTWPVWLPLAALAAAFLFGWFGQGFGDERLINLLAFPLLGLLAWNVIVLVFGMFSTLAVMRRRGAGGSAGGGGRSDATEVGGNGWQSALIRRLVVPASAHGRLGGNRTHHGGGIAAPDRGESSDEEVESESGALARRAEARFLVLWSPVLRGRAAALVEASLHGAAAMLVLGLVAVMYVKGVGFQFRAGWESTFFDAGQVHRFFSVVFGPASAITGFRVAVPGIEEIAAGEVSRGGEGIAAAPWIHLYALTALIFVFVPRGLLGWLAWRRARRAGRLLFESDRSGWDAYVARLLRGLRGGGEVVAVRPFAFQATSRSREALRRLVADEWGGAAMVEFLAPVDYGDVSDEESAAGVVAADEDERDGLIAWFSLGSTPEDEVHGEFLRSQVRRAAGTRVVVLLDGAGFRERFGSLPEFERRRSERARAWRRVTGSGVDLRILDPGEAAEWTTVPELDASERPSPRASVKG